MSLSARYQYFARGFCPACVQSKMMIREKVSFINNLQDTAPNLMDWTECSHTLPHAWISRVFAGSTFRGPKSSSSNIASSWQEDPSALTRKRPSLLNYSARRPWKTGCSVARWPKMSENEHQKLFDIFGRDWVLPSKYDDFTIQNCERLGFNVWILENDRI